MQNDARRTCVTAHPAHPPSLCLLVHIVCGDDMTCDANTTPLKRFLARPGTAQVLFAKQRLPQAGSRPWHWTARHTSACPHRPRPRPFWHALSRVERGAAGTGANEPPPPPWPQGRAAAPSPALPLPRPRPRECEKSHRWQHQRCTAWLAHTARCRGSSLSGLGAPAALSSVSHTTLHYP